MNSAAMNSYKASESNDVNGSRATPVPASGRRMEVSSTVTTRNPQNISSTQDQTLTTPYKVRRIVGDGNCLFRSVSLFLHNTQENHMELRSDAVHYIRRHWNDVKDYKECGT
uniref:OTU domain-containing protein n=1 Tax=Cacopsylla melanoneura TaxID=428564 RepID=A0A8D9F915_9HEMI